MTQVGNYNLSVFFNGVEVAPTVDINNENVIYANGIITVGGVENDSYEATITVSYKGVTIATYTAAIDTRQAEANTEEVLISKGNSQIYTNNAPTLAGMAITDITYEGASVYSDGLVDTSVINVAVDTPFTLRVFVGSNFVDFTNVKLYDGIYCQENKSELVDLLDYSGTLTGHYILVSNITFESTDEIVSKASAGTTYNATFDGRGYTLSDVYIKKQTTNQAYPLERYFR